MQKILFISVLAGIFVVTSSTCVSENNTIDRTEMQKNLLAFRYGSTNFAMDMFRSLYNGSSNLFFSPLSVWISLATMYAGSRQLTAKELANVLGISDINLSSLTTSLSTFLEICSSCKEDRSTVKIANRIYFREDLDLKMCDPELAKIFYKIDFRTDPEEARTVINDYVSNQTNGKILELVPPLSIGPTTQMIIVNAVYFKGIWENQFNKTMTRPLRFYQDRETILTVPMMNTVGKYIYGVSDQMDCQALEIPYDGGNIRMLILLPRHTFRGLDILGRTITPERLETLINSMSTEDVVISIPKFKVSQKYELSKTLQKIGLRNLFDPRFSDLSGFTETRRLSIDAVHHKSYIKVNEEGTEAAAATGGLFSRESHPTGIVRFIADRPFLYMIHDSDSKIILFIGTVTIPQYKESNEYA